MRFYLASGTDDVLPFGTDPNRPTFNFFPGDFPQWWLALAIGTGFIAWFVWVDRYRGVSTPAVVIGLLAGTTAFVSGFLFLKFAIEWLTSPLTSITNLSSGGALLLMVGLAAGAYLWANSDS